MPLADDHAALLDQYDHAGLLLRERDPEWLTTPQPNVSGWSAAQHLAHLEAVNRSVLTVLRRLERAGAQAVPEASTPVGMRVLTTGAFPRGVARAPEATVPAEDLSLDDVRETLATNRARWEALDLGALAALPGTLPHPLLGPLTASQWVRFARIHTGHHHAIIGELT